MTMWVTKSRLYLLSTVMKHGTSDWKLVSDVINNHLSTVSVKSDISGEVCEEEYGRLVSGDNDKPTSSNEPSLQGRLVEELRKLRIEEIDAQLSLCKQKYFNVHEDKQAVESGRLSKHYAEICKEIERKGNGFSLRAYCEEKGSRLDVNEKEGKSGQKNRIKSKSAKSNTNGKDANKADPAMIVTIPTTQLPPPLPVPGTSSSRRGDRSQTPSIDTHSLNIGSPSCTETSRDMESKSEHSFVVIPKHNRSVMRYPIKDCVLTRIEKEEGASGVKTWRKAILLVWREATQHKYANVFLNPVTNEEAPGYRNIVQFPLDLNTVKRSVESGKITTTREFQRDIMLIFVNAIMYNRSDHVVSSMAQEMLCDVVESIESFIDTQIKLYEQKQMGADDEGRISVMKTRSRRANLEEDSMGVAKRKRVDLF